MLCSSLFIHYVSDVLINPERYTLFSSSLVRQEVRGKGTETGREVGEVGGAAKYESDKVSLSPSPLAHNPC